MPQVKLTQEEHDSLICRLAILEAENHNLRMLLEAPAKNPGWWKRFWGRGGYVAAAALVLVLATLGIATSVWSGMPSYYFKGNFYLKVSEGEKIGYISGAMDAIWLLSWMGEEDALTTAAVSAKLASCTKGMSNSQVKAIVEKYMKDHPENWHHVMADIIIGALMDACKKR